MTQRRWASGSKSSFVCFIKSHLTRRPRFEGSLKAIIVWVKGEGGELTLGLTKVSRRGITTEASEPFSSVEGVGGMAAPSIRAFWRAKYCFCLLARICAIPGPSPSENVTMSIIWIRPAFSQLDSQDPREMAFLDLKSQLISSKSLQPTSVPAVLISVYDDSKAGGISSGRVNNEIVTSLTTTFNDSRS